MSASVLVFSSSYVPMNRVNLHRAINLVLKGKAEVLLSHGVQRSEKLVIELPRVIRMLYNIVRRGKHRVALTKKNVLLRDRYLCGYCGSKGDRQTMTVDHVHPKSRGGPATWQNLAACCMPCNGRKRNRTPQEAGMTLRHALKVPEYIPFIVVREHEDDEEMIKILTLYGVSLGERIG